MNKYESIIILDSQINDEQRNNVIEKIKNFILEKGKINKCDDIGIKKLAYEIRKQTNGYYYVINFEMESQHILELERIYRITDEVMKYVTIRKDN